MKPAAFALFACLLAAAAALAAGGASAAAPEAQQQETRAVSGFHRIEINGRADVTLVQGAGEGVTVEATPALLSHIVTEVRHGTLVVDIAHSHSFWRLFSTDESRTPHVTVRLRELDRIEAGGTVNLDADSLKSDELSLDLAGACTLKLRDLQATSLRLDGSGAIKATIAGKVTRQRIDLSGAGSYSAEKLVSNDVFIDVSGAGTAVVNAIDTLKVDISGAGKVEYVGDPQLKQSISGIGQVSRR